MSVTLVGLVGLSVQIAYESMRVSMSVSASSYVDNSGGDFVLFSVLIVGVRWLISQLTGAGISVGAGRSAMIELTRIW